MGHAGPHAAVGWCVLAAGSGLACAAKLLPVAPFRYYQAINNHQQPRNAIATKGGMRHVQDMQTHPTDWGDSDAPQARSLFARPGCLCRLPPGNAIQANVNARCIKLVYVNGGKSACKGRGRACRSWHDARCKKSTQGEIQNSLQGKPQTFQKPDERLSLLRCKSIAYGVNLPCLHEFTSNRAK